MENIQIRVARIADLPHLLNWGHELHFVEKQFEPLLKYSESEVSARYSKQIIDPNFLFLIAELDERPVGYLYAHIDLIDYLDTDRPVCEIEVVFVEITARGHGLAQKLIAQAIEWAKNNNCIEIKTGIYSDNNCSRKAFEKAGFTPKHITYTYKLD